MTLKTIRESSISRISNYEPRTNKVIDASKIGDFQLVTFDGGKNWYNYKYEKDKGLVVIGVADPKVIRYQERMRDFIERVKRGEKPILSFYEEEK